MYFEFTVEKSELEKDVYSFWYDDRKHQLVLSSFIKSTRQTKRHGWKTQHVYSNTLKRDNTLNREQIIMTEDFMQQVKARFVETLSISFN